MKKYLFLILCSSLILSACGQSKSVSAPTPTSTPKLVEMESADRPDISLIPRNDGHELALNISSISSKIMKIEYELTYTATDNSLEIEKGASGIIESKDLSAGKVQRKILLGTESCTSGCKYKYDAGVTGGELNLTFTFQNNQISTFNTPFILRSSTDIKKAGKLTWNEENYTFTPKSFSGYFIALKDFRNASYLVTNSAQF